MRGFLCQSRAKALLAGLAGLGIGAASLGPVRALLPDDLVWRPKPGGTYVLGAIAKEETSLSWQPAASRDDGERRPPEAGTHVRLLRVERDSLHRPLMFVRALDGPHAGDRGHVTRWQVRHAEPPAWLGLTPARLMCGALAASSGAMFWAVLVLLCERPQRERSTAPRQAE